VSLDALNRALQSHTLVWRRLFVIFAAVVAILGGLLAMHSFSTHTDHGSAVAAADGGHSHGATDPHVAGLHEAGSHAAAADECADGLCTPGHSSELTACLLALLVATIILAVRSVPGRALLLLIVALASARLQMSVARPARPPSLVALSISRT
jgi:hypothetical protein